MSVQNCHNQWWGETRGARYDNYLNTEIMVHTFKQSESDIKAL